MLQIASHIRLTAAVSKGKWPRFLGDLAQPVVERLDAVGGADDLVQHRREGQEGYEPVLGVCDGLDRPPG